MITIEYITYVDDQPVLGETVRLSEDYYPSDDWADAAFNAQFEERCRQCGAPGTWQAWERKLCPTCEVAWRRVENRIALHHLLVARGEDESGHHRCQLPGCAIYTGHCHECTHGAL